MNTDDIGSIVLMCTQKSFDLINSSHNMPVKGGGSLDE